MMPPAHRPVRFGEKDSPEPLLDLGTRMLAVLCAQVPDATEVVAVASAFAVPLVDQDTGAVLDVLTKTKQPDLYRYWTTRDRAANARPYRLAAEILAAVDAGVFPPRIGWHCQDCLVRSRCWAWGLRSNERGEDRRDFPHFQGGSQSPSCRREP